jgi:hypothetical protein
MFGRLARRAKRHRVGDPPIHAAEHAVRCQVE